MGLNNQKIYIQKNDFRVQNCFHLSKRHAGGVVIPNPAQQLSALNSRQVILMRGLPGCGKTTTARKLAGDRGVVCEFDDYFYSQVGDDPKQYNWDDRLVDNAQRWNLEQFIHAVDSDAGPVIVDNCNGANPVTRQYVTFAIARRCRIAFCEPDSPQWSQIKPLLADKRANHHALVEWAHKLANMSKNTHRVGFSLILSRIERWQNDVTIQDVLMSRAA